MKTKTKSCGTTQNYQFYFYVAPNSTLLSLDDYVQASIKSIEEKVSVAYCVQFTFEISSFNNVHHNLFIALVQWGAYINQGEISMYRCRKFWKEPRNINLKYGLLAILKKLSLISWHVYVGCKLLLSVIVCQDILGQLLLAYLIGFKE